MKIHIIQPFEDLQQMCRQMDAPVFPRHKKRSNTICFVRRNNRTIAEVEQFFAAYMAN